jgi:hypothetical protein
VHLQVTLDNGVLGENAIVFVDGITAMSDSADLVAFLEGLRHIAADLLDDARVVATEDASVLRDPERVVLPIRGVERDMTGVLLAFLHHKHIDFWWNWTICGGTGRW